MTLNSVLKRSMGAAGLALAASMAASPAHAISGSMSWDPYYGPPFVGTNNSSTADDMYWSGTGTYNFIGCSLPLTGTITVTSCSTMCVNNVVVNLAVGQANSIASNFFATLAFTGQQVQIFEATFEGGNLVSIHTDYFDPWASTSATNFGVNNYDFSLTFEDGGATLYHAIGDGYYKHDHTGHYDPDKFWNGVGKGHLAQFCSSDPTTFKTSNDYCGFSAEKATVTFAPIASIPEPQTYALMLVGLAAVGFVTRRRRRPG